MKTILKYITLTILGVTIFVAVNATRTTPGFGGEAVFLALPVMWWAFERTIKDTIADFKRMKRKQEVCAVATKSAARTPPTKSDRREEKENREG